MNERKKHQIVAKNAPWTKCAASVKKNQVVVIFNWWKAS